jgi:hypothetical protein
MKKYLFALLVICSTVNAADYRTQLDGKILSMNGAKCAGLSLKKNSGLLSIGSDPNKCEVELPTKVRWIDGSTFILIESNRINEISPPRTFLYKVKSINGNKVVLTEIWTGWNNYPDSDSSYTLK